MARRSSPHIRLPEQVELDRRIIGHLRSLPAGEAVVQRQLAMRLSEPVTTVNDAVARLLKRGYVETAEAHGPAKPIRLCPDRALAAGLAVSEGGLRLAVVNLRAEVVAEHSQPQVDEPAPSPAEFADRVESLLLAAISAHGGQRQNLSSLCLALDGQVDSPAGVVTQCNVFGWRDVPLRDILCERLGCRATIRGMKGLSNAAAEALAGVGVGRERMLYFGVGNGIAVHLVERGRVKAAAFGYGGELGHIPITQIQQDCPCPVCGSPYCLEANASGLALAREYCRQRGLPFDASQARPAFGLLMADAEAGQQAARVLIENALNLWSAGVVVGLNAYDSPVVALSGWCLRDHPALAERLALWVRQRLSAGPRRLVHIELARLGPGRHDLAAASEAMQDLLGESPAPAPPAAASELPPPPPPHHPRTRSQFPIDSVPTDRPFIFAALARCRWRTESRGSSLYYNVIDSLRARAQQAGQQVLFQPFSLDDNDPGRLEELAANPHLRGVLTFDHGHARVMRAAFPASMPVVALDHCVDLGLIVKTETGRQLREGEQPCPGVGYIASDNFRAGVELTQHLLDRGHRQIGFVGGDPTYMTALERIAGYEDAMARAALPVKRAPYLLDDELQDLPWANLQADGVTALIAHNDWIALRILNLLYHQGVRVPQDISLVSFDDLVPLMAHLSPAITAMAIPYEAMAELAWQALTGQVTLAEALRLPYRLMERGSVAAPGNCEL